MKLNDFLTKSNKPRPQQKRTISFVNETKETELKNQIAELESEVTRLQDMENQYTQMQSQFIALQEHSSNSQSREDKLNEQIMLLEAEVERGEGIKKEKEELEDVLRDIKGQHSTQVNTLDMAQKANMALTNDIQKLNTQVEALTNDNEQLTDAFTTSSQQAIDHQNELEDIKQQFNEIDKVFSTTQVKYKQETKKNSELSRDLSHWQRVAHTLQEEKEDLEQTRKMLRAWAEAVEADYQNSTEIGRVNKSEIQKMRKVITAMNEQIAQLMDENEYLVDKNAVLIDEIMKPRYMSMGAIERAEGFKLPSGSYFKGKNFLGNGTPTLLAFKKEAQNGN